MMAPPVKSGPRYNQMINVPKVRVIDENGENLGVMYTREAIEQAAEVGLDTGVPLTTTAEVSSHQLFSAGGTLV